MPVLLVIDQHSFLEVVTVRRDLQSCRLDSAIAASIPVGMRPLPNLADAFFIFQRLLATPSRKLRKIARAMLSLLASALMLFKGQPSQFLGVG